MADEPVMMIAIRCDAGRDVTGKERKVTVFIDQMGRLHDARLGWPEADETGFFWGPILRITPDEWLLQVQIALGCGA